MSLIPRPLVESDLTFTPLFRFLDDFNKYSGDLAETKSFTPKFDIQEHKHSYSLHGELPGVEKKDVEIEWSDPQVCFYLFFIPPSTNIVHTTEFLSIFRS
jgi:HSP20 family protein